MCHKKSLRANFLSRVHFSEQELDMICQRVVYRKVKKRKELLVEGNIPQYVVYIIKGLLRMYALDQRGKEFTIELAAEDTWMADLKSFYGRSSSTISIEALEDSEVFLLHYDDVEFLHSQIPSLAHFSRLHAEEKYSNAMQRLQNVNHMGYTAQQRLVFFETSYAKILGRLPAHVIASFLGISEETYSRIRRRKKVGRPTS